MPPPTSPPFTSPPPTIPPPTIPPPTISSDLDAQISAFIDQLEQFGDTFQDAIDQLRDLQNRF
jgi:hypothetical protein